MTSFLSSPLNYIGGKHKLLSQIIPLFPKKTRKFVDLFCGGCNVGINVDAENIIFNDNLSFLIELYKSFQANENQIVLNHVVSRIKQFNLSLTNASGYLALRELYNKEKNPLDLFVLVAYSFNHQIRFNNSHQFNNPFGRNRSSFNSRMKENLIKFLNAIHSKNVQFSCRNFDEFDYSILDQDDFIYCDPPYLITTGTYNDGKRGFTGWSENEERNLLELLKNLNDRKIKFALSNVTEHKGLSNDLLKNWISENEFYVSYLNKDYSNSNYQVKNRNPNLTIEVLVTNYEP